MALERNLLLDIKYHCFVQEQYEKISRAQIKFYQATKGDAKYEIAPKCYITPLPKISHAQLSLNKRREDIAEKKRAVEKAKTRHLSEKMWKVDPETRAKLYQGTSRDTRSLREGTGRRGYLYERNKLAPEEKYTQRLASSWDYGWEVVEEMDAYRRPKFGNISQIHEKFFTRNRIPMFCDPQGAGGVCSSQIVP